MQVEVRYADRAKVLAALEGAARLTRTEIYNGVFGRHRTHEQLETLGSTLEADGAIIRLRVEPAGGTQKNPVEIWQKTKAHSVTESNGALTSGMERPPAGEGWLSRRAIMKKARRGVMPAHAARVGRRIRLAEQSRNKGTGTGRTMASDEQRGATHLITETVNMYRKQGVVEVQGEWIRLVANPPRRPRHHWNEALLHFLAQGHPTLDGKWHPKPSTVRGAFEQALGRKLEAWEQARRRPGHAGSWDPEDLLLFDFASDTIKTLAEIESGV